MTQIELLDRSICFLEGVLHKHSGTARFAKEREIAILKERRRLLKRRTKGDATK